MDFTEDCLVKGLFANTLDYKEGAVSRSLPGVTKMVIQHARLKIHLFQKSVIKSTADDFDFLNQSYLLQNQYYGQK